MVLSMMTKVANRVPRGHKCIQGSNAGLDSKSVCSQPEGLMWHDVGTSIMQFCHTYRDLPTTRGFGKRDVNRGTVGGLGGY